jgi:hypothetical protein
MRHIDGLYTQRLTDITNATGLYLGAATKLSWWMKRNSAARAIPLISRYFPGELHFRPLDSTLPSRRGVQPSPDQVIGKVVGMYKVFKEKVRRDVRGKENEARKERWDGVAMGLRQRWKRKKEV